MHGKKAKYTADEILSTLEADGLDIMMCRGQGYDNASTMAGVYGGVQAILKETNAKAIFNGCINHNLNLSGQHSFAENVHCVTFFGALESMYSFFVSSTARWEKMKKISKVTLKRLSDTRWSAHHAAVKAVKISYLKLVELIQNLSLPLENVDTRGAALVLLPSITNLTFVSFLFFWDKVLHEVQITQLYLQRENLGMDEAVRGYENLITFINDQRENLVNDAIEESKRIVVDELKLSTEKRSRKIKKHFDEMGSTSVHLALEATIRQSMFQCLDRFHTELNTRMSSVKQICTLFHSIFPINIMKEKEKPAFEEETDDLSKFADVSTATLRRE